MAAPIEYRVTPLPAVWPGKATPEWKRGRSPFKTVWTRALALLSREVRMLDGKRVEIAVDIDPRHLRQDGQLRADARPKSPAVIVSFEVPSDSGRDRLQFPADRFGFWQDNVDAVARALEALRMVDRYGVQQGRQYAGFKALPGAGQSTATMTAHDAARTVAFFTGGDAAAIVADPVAAAGAIRLARAKTHPDAGGTDEAFSRVGQARAVLTAHHGRAL